MRLAADTTGQRRSVLADPDRRYYDLVLSDVGSRLAPGVRDALP